MAPEKPLYPFAPTELDSILIHYGEVEYYFSIGLIGFLISLIAMRITRQSLAVAFIATLVSGAIYATLESLRFGIFPHYIDMANILAFVLGALCVCGFFSLITELRKHASSNNK
ncbi:hypothetical protein KFE80_00390 [bacterium SCSIO 12696]|nr:hypothetical protein KFE80_00390 [bacterium SCSIO 12696]